MYATALWFWFFWCRGCSVNFIERFDDVFCAVDGKGISNHLFRPLSWCLGMVSVGKPFASICFLPRFVCFSEDVFVSILFH